MSQRYFKSDEDIIRKVIIYFNCYFDIYWLTYDVNNDSIIDICVFIILFYIIIIIIEMREWVSAVSDLTGTS